MDPRIINRRKTYILEEKIAARTTQHEGEEYIGKRTAGRGKKTKGEARQKSKKEQKKGEEMRENRTPGVDRNMGARLC